MIATIMATFTDAPEGREEKTYFVGDVVSMSKGDFDRIHGQNPNLVKEGKINLGTGICYPCLKGASRTRRK